MKPLRGSAIPNWDALCAVSYAIEMLNVVYKRAGSPTNLLHLLQLCRSSTHQNTINIIAILVQVVSTVSPLHVRELCPGSLQRVQRARACRLTPPQLDSFCSSATSLPPFEQ